MVSYALNSSMPLLATGDSVMISTKKLLVSLALAFSVQGLSLAQDELVLRDHHHLIHGEVVSSTPDSVTFKHVVGDASDTQTYAGADIEPVNFYIIRSHAVKGDAAAMMELGRFCQANGLYTRARNQFTHAKKLNESLDITADMAAAKKGSATDLVAKAQKLAKDGKHKEACHQANTVIRRFPGTASADEARKISAAAHKSIVGKRNADLAAHVAKKGNEDIRLVHTETHKAADYNAKAMQMKNSSSAHSQFGHAISEYSRALKNLKGLAKKYSGNEDLTKEVNDLLAQTKKDIVEVYINLGSGYLVQTSYQEALKQANAAIAVDPNSAAAKSFRSQVAAASADSEIDFYGRGGRRRGGVIRR